MSTLIEDAPSVSDSQEREEPFVSSGKLSSDHLYRGLLVLTGLFFVIFAVFWSGAVYAFGAGWYSLLSALLCFTMARNIAREQTGVYKLRDATVWLKVATLSSMFVTFLAFLLLCIRPPVNFPERALKPIFSLITFFCLQGLYFVLIRAPTVPTPQTDFLSSFIESSTFARISQMDLLQKKEVPEELPPEKIERALKCRICCRDCCTYVLLFLVWFAGITVIVLFHRGGLYFEDVDELFIQASATNSDQVMNFRCSGEGEPLVLLFHGYTGQALDMEHFKVGLEQNTTVCSFSRFGYGLSQRFGELSRTSSNFAIELDIALSNLDIDASKTENTILVGHSMAGFNMRAYDKQFPGRVGAMVMIDPVDPELTDDCFTDGIDINTPFNEANMRLIDIGGGVISEMLGIHYIVAPLDKLPKNIQTQYIANLYRPEHFIVSREEALNWGESCEFVKDHTATYPVTVLIPEKGIYNDGRLEDAENIQNFSNNTESRTISLLGGDAGHTEAIFDLKFAQIAIDATQEYIDQLRP